MSEKLSKKELNKKTFIAGTFFVITQLIVRGISFITTPIYTRLVSTAQYGEIRVYESWLLIAVPIFSLCLYRSVERAKFDYPDKFEEYVSAVQTLSYLVTFGCFAVITLFFRKPFMEFSEMNTLLYVFLILFTFANTGLMFFQRREKQLLRYKQSTFITTITMIPATILSVLLLYAGGLYGYEDKLVDLRVIGFYTPQIIGGIAVILLMWKQGRCFVNKEYWKYALAFSLPLIPEMLSIQIMNQADKILIQKLVGEHSAGIFSLGTTVSYITWIVEDSVWQAWLPWFFEKIDRDEVSEIKTPWMQVVYIFAYMSWGLSILAPEVVLILGGKKYYDAIYLVAPMVTGTLFRFFSYSYTAAQNYYKKTKNVAIGTVGTMIFNICLSATGIYFFGYRAAAYTTMSSYFILLVVQGLLEKKETGSNIIPLGMMIKASAVCFLLNVATMLTYQLQWYVRYALVLVSVAVMAKVMLPMLKSLLKQLKKS